ncbi:MAG: outer membrane protein transport protein [Novosphingobium sp.]
MLPFPALFRLSGGALLVALAVLPGMAHATDGYLINGMGAKARGAGGVAIAMPEDALAIAANPAAATELGHRADLGVEFFMPRRGARIEGNMAGLDGRHSGNGVSTFVLPEVGYVRPLSDRVAVGIAINGNGGMNTTYKRNPFASFGATGKAGVDLKQVFITPTVAVRVVEGHSLGVSPIIMAQSFEARGIQPFAGASSDPARFSNRGTGLSTGFGLRVGYLGTVVEGVRVGAFYQTKVWEGRFKRYSGLFADKGSFDVPASWGVGISVKPDASLTLGADFKRIEYSEVESVGNPLAPLFVGVPFGAPGGPGFGWRDISVIKVGGAWQASEKLTLRAGYGHAQNPVRASQTFLNILAPGVVKDHFTAGATAKLASGLEVTGYAMHAPRKTVRGQASIPANFGGGEADVHLSETALGLSLGVEF